MLRAKLHMACVTEACLEYTGSLTVDLDLLDAVGLKANEEVLVANLANGARFRTYIFEGERGSGVMCVNGAAAHLAKEGDRIIVMAFGYFDDEEAKTHRPKVAILDENNRITQML